MGKGIIVIVVIIGIFIVMGMVREGTETFQEPLQSVIESSKVIVSTGIGMIKGDEEENRSLFTEIGLVPCVTNDDCNVRLEKCNNVCMCLDGVCAR